MKVSMIFVYCKPQGCCLVCLLFIYDTNSGFMFHKHYHENYNWSNFVCACQHVLFPLHEAFDKMGRRKSKRKPPPKKKMTGNLDTQFTCPFCNHEKSCDVKM